MVSARKKRRPPRATCGACGKTFTGRTLDDLNAKLGRHYRVCPKPLRA
jgi:hypothetical protein